MAKATIVRKLTEQEILDKIRNEEIGGYEGEIILDHNSKLEVINNRVYERIE